ncbi:nuclear transport factor 2 family protein [Spirosoma fluminis]
MKSFLTLCLLLLVQLVRAQSGDEKAVLDVEKQRFDAQVNKDQAVMNKVLADDLLYTHSNGNTDGKQAFIQAIVDGKSNYTGLQPQEQKVRLYGNTAVVNGVVQVKMNNNNQPTEFKLRYTDVYVKKSGQWQLVAWQSLRLTQ